MPDTDLQSKFFARGMVDTPIHKCHGIAAYHQAAWRSFLTGWWSPRSSILIVGPGETTLPTIFRSSTWISRFRGVQWRHSEVKITLVVVVLPQRFFFQLVLECRRGILYIARKKGSKGTFPPYMRRERKHTCLGKNVDNARKRHFCSPPPE